MKPVFFRRGTVAGHNDHFGCFHVLQGLRARPENGRQFGIFAHHCSRQRDNARCWYVLWRPHQMHGKHCGVRTSEPRLGPRDRSVISFVECDGFFFFDGVTAPCCDLPYNARALARSVRPTHAENGRRTRTCAFLAVDPSSETCICVRF